jgi:hypothetical protein
LDKLPSSKSSSVSSVSISDSDIVEDTDNLSNVKDVLNTKNNTLILDILSNDLVEVPVKTMHIIKLSNTPNELGENIKIVVDNLNDMKKNQLVDLCKNNNLAFNGTKLELIKRLIDFTEHSSNN